MHRTVHVSMDERLICACYDLVAEKLQLDPRTLPMAKVVRLVVENTLNQFIQDGEVKLRDRHSANAYLNELQLSTNQLGGNKPITWERESILQEDSETTQEIEKLSAQVTQRMLEMSDPKVERDVEVTSSVDEPVETQYTLKELKALERKPFELIAERAPNDPFVLAVIEQREAKKPSDLLQTAVEVVYSNLPRDLWGTETAKRNISQLMQKTADT